MYRKLCFPLLILFILAACAPFESEPPTPMVGDPNATAVSTGNEPPPLNPYAPGKGDESLARGEVYIDSLSILVQESFPPQYLLEVKGALPTPCHDLRAVVDVPATGSRIDVQIYSVVDPSAVCTQVLKPFDASIPLGSYVRGSYEINVNGKPVGEITP